LLWRSPLPGRGRRLLALLLPAAMTLAGSRWVADVAQTHGVNFFAGRFWVRAAVRLPHWQEILGNAAEFLLAPDWLGIWIVLGLASGALLARRSLRQGPAALLAGLLLLLLTVYVSVYFVTVLSPMDHLRGSFFRLLGPLTPLALLVIAEVAAGTRAGPPPARPPYLPWFFSLLRFLLRLLRLGAAGGAIGGEARLKGSEILVSAGEKEERGHG
ncbi:MAG TPA: hypothetical protein VMM92_12775, partial [Thermoanaerobaculia bacterium]|nr:hypothetical protein [Thermoanaerobaculia bacterium]